MATTKRRALSKRVRFEVFKRDSFSCQYCGRSAPDVLLHVDHINPVAAGGLNDIINLITACSDCNGGKGAVLLDDQSAASKQMRQLKELNERREQIKLIAKWREGLIDLEESQLQVIDDRIGNLCKCRLTPTGRANFKKSIKKYGLEAVLEALETSANQYLLDDEPETIQKFIQYTHKICFWNKQRETKPELEQFSYICNLAKKRWWRCDRSALWKLVNNAYYEHGVSTDDMLKLAGSTTGIMQFHRGLEELLEEVSDA